MDLKYLKEIIAHEIGHLCISILRSKTIPEIQVTKLLISNEICHKGPWCGQVEYEPQEILDNFEEVIKNHDLLAFSLIGLTAGCYFQNYIPDHDSLEFNDCFKNTNKDAVGYGDSYNYYLLESDFRILHSESNSGREELVKSTSKLVFEKFKEHVSLSKDFIKAVQKITDDIAFEIVKDYKKNGAPKRYTFSIEGAFLNQVINDLEKSMLQDKFGKGVVTIVNKLKLLLDNYPI